MEGCSHLSHIFLSVSLKNILYLGEGQTYDIPPLLVVSPCFGSVVLVVVKKKSMVMLISFYHQGGYLLLPVWSPAWDLL
jgi:hypothetical protein